ncbi:hypothetical protein PAHAL_1G142100 [Panicum hallii]|jgi:hypothetical protein|uniref:Uncharacterized protein n=1 Tax=Panicum hallii TaxID=206008 RepID=A0A2T8KV71_9POAL|nr:hypothetical protein PAHAL_1G142100 [Panicum hallii]
MVVSIIPDFRDGHAILQRNIYVWDIRMFRHVEVFMDCPLIVVQRKICIFSRFSDVIHVRGCVNSSILPTGDLETISISLRTVELDGKWIKMKN